MEGLDKKNIGLLQLAAMSESSRTFEYVPWNMYGLPCLEPTNDGRKRKEFVP
jgi:hypothetical protein